MQQQQQQQQQQSKEDLMAYTNDLCRLASKAHAWGLQKDDLARLHSDIDAIKHIAESSTSPSSSRSSSFSSFASSSPPSSPLTGSTLSSPLSSSPPASSPSSGFLSSTLSALSANATFHADAAADAGQAVDLMSAMGSTGSVKTVGSGGGDGPKRRNRGKNLPKDMKRACTICKAEKTSQWRSGADGRPTLCNACGLRYRHSMKQHRQYLARTQVRGSAGSEAVAVQQQQPNAVLQAGVGFAATAASSADLFQHLLHLRQQQVQHMSKSDSADAIGSEDESSSCSSSSPSSLVSSPIDAMPRRSSIYNLLN